MQTVGVIPRLSTFDANGYLSAFRQGEQDQTQRNERENRLRIGQIASDQGYLAGAREALSSGDMDWATRLSQMDTQRQAQIHDTLGRLASAADTPDRWNTLIAQMRTRFGADSVQGFENFSSRPQAIRISMTALQNLEQQHRERQLAETRRLHDAQIAHLTTQDAAIGETQEMRRRQMDAQNLSRDRGFTLQALRSLAAARTPQEFQLVAQTLRPMLGRVPGFQERDRLLQSAMDSLEEYDMVPDEQGRPQRVSRGWSPLVMAAIGPGGVGQGQVQGDYVPGAQPPRPAPAARAPTAIADAFNAVNPQLIQQNTALGISAPRPDIAPNQGLSGIASNHLNQALPGAPQPANQNQQPTGPLPMQAPPQPAQPSDQPMVGQPMAGQRPGLIQPIAAPGGVPPPVVGGPGAAVPVQGGGGPPRPVARGGAMAQQQAMIDEIEQQYGQPNTWGQNGTAAPPHSVIQRYWRAVRGGRAVTGYDYAADGTFVPIGGAPQRGGGGNRGGGSQAAQNAARALESAAGQVSDAAEALLHPDSSMAGNLIQSIPGVATLGFDAFQHAQRTISFATREVMHALSGATVTAREFEHYVQTFVPVATDTERQRRFKINSLRQIILSLAQAQNSSGGPLSDTDLAGLRMEMRNENRRLLGLQNIRGPQATPGGGSPPPAQGGGWGSAGGMSTQDILNQFGRR